LAEGIVRNQKCIVIDNEIFRKRDFWLKFLPAVAEVKQVEESKENQEQLKVAWRYNDLLEQRPEQKTIKPGNNQTPEYKFDSSRPMGEAVAN
jgi:hypothetical protein